MGRLLLWAAENYGVRATGITLSKNQLAHVQRLIDERGLGGRVRVELRDYRALPEDEPFDKIASIGMFEHVGRAQLPSYFAKLHRLLVPGGLLMNHGITAGGTRNTQLGAGIGPFIERYIFPAASCCTCRACCRRWPTPDGRRSTSRTCARTTHARCGRGPDALEARLADARASTTEQMLRAYRLYLAGSAMAFERGWMSLHRYWPRSPRANHDGRDARGTIDLSVHARPHLPIDALQVQSPRRRRRDHARAPWRPVLRLVGREPAPRGIFEVDAMPGLIAALQAAVSADEAARQGRAAADDRADAPAQGRNDGVALRQRVWPWWKCCAAATRRVK